MSSDLRKAHPRDVRALIRSGKLKRLPTPLYCEGYKQTNLAIMPSNLASDLQKFAQANWGAVPLLYTSKPGEFEAPDLCKDSDVRMDVPIYKVIQFGSTESEVEYLTDYDLSNMVTFYIGCSFSFYKILIDCGATKPKQAGKETSAYKTNIECYPSGPFQCKMVVSMQAVHKSKLTLACTLTSLMSDVHGAPIHIGSPNCIGIEDVTKCDFENETAIEEDCAPVFWCCGLTGLEALRSAKLELSFTHGSSQMFITDVQQPHPNLNDLPRDNYVEVFWLSGSQEKYSIISERTKSTLQRIANILLEKSDSFNAFAVEKFLSTCLGFSHARKVAFVLGGHKEEQFDRQKLAERIQGVINLSVVLLNLKKEVTIIADAQSIASYKAVIKHCQKEGLLPEGVKFQRFEDGLSLRFDVVLTTESDEKQAMINTNTSFHGDMQFSTAQGMTNSIWCGFCFALYVLRACPTHDRYLRKAVGFPTEVGNLVELLPSRIEVKTRIEEIVDAVATTNGFCVNYSTTKADSCSGNFVNELKVAVGLQESNSSFGTNG